MKSYQCHNCKKNFNTQVIYLWGKDKHSFCQSCNEKNKKKCSWCEKDLNCQPSKFSKLGCSLHNHHETKRWDDDGSSEYEWRVFCDDNCEKQFNQYQENTPERIAEKEKAQELLNKGWKPCEGQGVFSFLAGLEKCGVLIPPTENYCDRCKKNKHEQEKRKEIEKDLEKRKKEYEEKYKKAQNWWNSLNEEEKKKQIKDLEEKWKEEGWHSRMFDKNGNILEFKDGKIYYDKWDEIPAPFLEKFGIGFDYSEYVSKGSKSFSPNDKQKKIKDLESKLKEAKKSGNKTEIDNLEKEIQKLKNRQKREKTASEKSQNTSPKHSCWPWIIGVGLVSLIIVIGVWRVKKFRKLKK